jgi:hypothetical protein
VKANTRHRKQENGGERKLEKVGKEKATCTFGWHRDGDLGYGAERTRT